MGNIKYTAKQIINEANYYISFKVSFKEAAQDLKMPLSTFGYHMLHRLKTIDADLYEKVYTIVKENRDKFFFKRERRVPNPV